MNKKSSILVVVIIVAVVLTILGTALLHKSITENNLAQKYLNSTRAFWLAEAGINEALFEIRKGNNSGGVNSFTDGDYEFTVVADGSNWKVAAYGCSPSIDEKTCAQLDDEDKKGCIQHVIEVFISKEIPLNFYDYPIFTAGDVNFNGNSFSVVNDELGKAVLYGGENDIEHPDNIEGSIDQDPTVNPIPRLDFEDILDMSLEQNTDTYPETGNIYDVSNGGKLIDPITKEEKALPETFWYIVDDIDGDGEVDDDENWVPNIVYIQGDLKINGQIGTIGGFLVVAGDVITNLEDEEFEDVAIVGEGEIEGVIYTLGELDINGGGTNGLEIDGGAWAGAGVTINGSADVLYNKVYMDAIKGLEIDLVYQIDTWRDGNNPYPLTP